MSCETDRMLFIGRGNTLVNPQAMRDVPTLSGGEGSVLDPIVAIRCHITLDPEQSATVFIVSGIGETRAACLTLIEKYQDQKSIWSSATQRVQVADNRSTIRS